jgi:hypothetical protein
MFALMVCVECGAVADDRAEGWRALLGGVPGEDDHEYVVVYCAQCAEREFGPPSRNALEREDGA